MPFLFVFMTLFVFAESIFAQNTVTSMTSRGNSFNPDIGMNLLVLGQNSNRGNDAAVEDRNGVTVQEAELQFSSDVDPYWRLVGTFSLHQEFTAGDSTAVPPLASTRDTVFEPEEAFAETTSLPGVTVRVGKYKAAFGKHNQLHSHAFPFIDAPLVNSQLLGSEGLNDVGVSAAVLLPLSWFSELTVQGMSGQGEGLDYFKSPSANDLVGLVHLKNLWDLSEDLTFELGASEASGKNSFSSLTNLYGLDATFKWRPDGSKERAIIWSTEAVWRQYDQTTTDERDSGMASWLQYQFDLRWWVQIRTEAMRALHQDLANSHFPENQTRQSVLIGFVPTEFSAIRLQYDHLNDGASDVEHKITIQLNYSIGAHPAHAY